jgi:hypothetical protein
MSHPIVQFFEGSGRDHAGRSLSDMLSFSDRQLEELHDYCQWMFPNRDPSRFNPMAPLVTDEVAAEFGRSPELRSGLSAATDRIERFYRFEDQRPWWVVPADHNHLRITRILLALRTLGLESRAADFYGKVSAAVRRNPSVVPERTLSFWASASK